MKWTIYKNGKKHSTFEGTFNEAWDHCEYLMKRSTAKHDYSFEQKEVI